MPHRIAVIDLGTNTFNLLVAEVRDKNHYTILHDRKLPVKLGEGGIQQGRILDKPRARALKAIGIHLKTASELEAFPIHAFGTSAIRTASNGPEFIEEIYRWYGLKVEMISGEREAELIYKGIALSVNLDENPCLILDIGGGSNEFILANVNGILWKNSFPLGMARILEIFKPSDPITTGEILSMEQYFDSNLPGLDAALARYPTRFMIGASGSFESFYSMLREIYPLKYASFTAVTSRILELGDFYALHQKLITGTAEQRLRIKGLEPMRVDMIVPASIFVNFILKKFNITELMQSDFSLKEGVLHELMKTIET